ncbi:MAG TPA: class I SAM-dependent methyltransferase [Nitrospirae bacterium]|nr:ubiquinone/menaquinone biosynthesis methyltransferase [bacterium BMS3Abin10]GBE38425.1 ubiquinone/menaquinone biosynthesis methyltransferase [bacterium BMS3Bbin08]HDO26415.1 class I SAM-dependent methyltransferase [Nitrospirota bacterium]
MFKNLINIHDFLKLAEKIKQGSLKPVLSKLISGKQEKIKKSWEHVQNPPTNWWDIPTVRERWNYLISGDAKIDYHEYVFRRFLSGMTSLNAMSLACGTGHREIRWAELSGFRSIDAYDLSEARIEYARNKARERGYGSIINYHVADVYNIEMRECYYDAVLAEQSLHHFSPLKKILLRINGFLKPNGYFIVNEFVGPTRFQWTDRQLEVVNGLLSLLPEKYRLRWNNGSVKTKVFRPGRLSMILSDPSEAVESSRILPLLNEIFEIIEIREYGGTILNLLFSEIAYNFLSEDSETQNFIRLCFEIEDGLLKAGDLNSDFVLAVCRKRNNNK